MYCVPILVFGGSEGIGSRFNVLRSLTHVFGGSEGVGSHFHFLRPRTRFRRCRRHRVSFSCFAFPDMFSCGAEVVGSRFHVLHSSDTFSAVARASDPICMFCVPKLVFDGTKVVGSRFHVLRSRTHFHRFRGRRVPFSCFALPDSFLAILRTSGPVFMFCAPELNFDCTDDVRSRFDVLHSQTRFRRCGGRQVQFSCFARPK
jgi:hypothetical protein